MSNKKIRSTPKENWYNKVIGVLDFETTGFLVGKNEIIEFSVHRGTLKKGFTRNVCALVKPSTPIPHYITKLTSITDDMVEKNGISQKKAARRLKRVLDKCDVVVCHSVQFDHEFAQYTYAKYGYDVEELNSKVWICTLAFARTQWGSVSGKGLHKLGACMERLNVTVASGAAHRASYDTEGTWGVLHALWKSGAIPKRWEDIVKIQGFNPQNVKPPSTYVQSQKTKNKQDFTPEKNEIEHTPWKKKIIFKRDDTGLAQAKLTSYLWIPKSRLKSSNKLDKHFSFEFDLSDTAESKNAQEKVEFIRNQLEGEGIDVDAVLNEYNDSQTITIKSWGQTKSWWYVSCGNLSKLYKFMKKLGIGVIDKRSKEKFSYEGVEKYKLTMRIPLRDTQIKPYDKWRNAGYGILKAAPAFGKTVVAIKAITELQMQTLVLVHTDALAEQFIERLRHGFKNKHGEFVRITNCLAIEEKLGGRLVGRYRNNGDLFPITVATYQAFSNNSRTRARFKEIQGEFGLVIVDEAHRSASKEYAWVVNCCTASMRLGISATPERKDNLHLVANEIIGPVVSVGNAKQLSVSAYLHKTNYKYAGKTYPGRGDWARMLTNLAESEMRTDFIMNLIKLDVEQGRKVLVISLRKQWCIDTAKKLVNEMNIRAGVITGGKGKQRDLVIEKMLGGELDVITATTVMDEGVDVANLDTLYLVSPMNNVYVLDQRCGRIRRFFEGKNKPIVRYMVDDGHGIFYGCAQGTKKAFEELGIPVTFVSEDESNEKVQRIRDAEKEVEKDLRKMGKVIMSNSAGFTVAADKSPARRKIKLNSIFDDADEKEKEQSLFNRRKTRIRTKK